MYKLPLPACTHPMVRAVNNAAATLNEDTFNVAVENALARMMKRRIRGNTARHITMMINVIGKFYFGVEVIHTVTRAEFETMQQQKLLKGFEAIEVENARDA